MTGKNKFLLQLVRSVPNKEIVEEPDSGAKEFGCKWLGCFCFRQALLKFLDGGRLVNWKNKFLLRYSGRGPFPEHAQTKLTNIACAKRQGKRRRRRRLRSRKEQCEDKGPNELRTTRLVHLVLFGARCLLCAEGCGVGVVCWPGPAKRRILLNQSSSSSSSN